MAKLPGIVSIQALLQLIIHHIRLLFHLLQQGLHVGQGYDGRSISLLEQDLV